MPKNKTRWEIVHNFENELRTKFLKNLGEKESLRFFNDLYNFGQKFVNKNYYNKLDLVKIGAIYKINSMFTKAAR